MSIDIYRADSGRLLLRRQVELDGGPTGRVTRYFDLSVSVCTGVCFARLWAGLPAGHAVGGSWPPSGFVPARTDEIGGELVRPMIGNIHAFRIVGGRPALDAVRLAWTGTDPLIGSLCHGLRPPTYDVDIGTPPTPSAPLVDDAVAAFHDGHIRLRDVHGAQIGDDNVQVNRYVADLSGTTIDFMEVLDDPDVQEAVARLQEAPRDLDRQHALIGLLTRLDVPFRFEPVTLRTGPVQGDGWLTTLLRDLFVLDVRGVQVGNHNRQVNRFVCPVTDPLSAAMILEGNTDLARLLVECLCPIDGPSPDTAAALLEKTGEILGRLPVRWHDHHHPVSVATPTSETICGIWCARGVVVGRGNVQTVSRETASALLINAAVPSKRKRFDVRLTQVVDEPPPPQRLATPLADTHSPSLLTTLSERPAVASPDDGIGRPGM